MTLDQLEYVLTVAQEGTLTAASQKLNVSHPAVSRGIANLEDELGINVFIRSRSGMEVTEEGKIVLESAENIMAEIDHLKDRLGLSGDGQIISVAVFPIDSLTFLPDVNVAFRRQCSYARISLHHMEISEATAKVRSLQMTFGICAFDENEYRAVQEEFRTVRLFTSRYAVGCNPETVQSEKGFLTTDEVREYPLILHDDSAIVAALTKIFGDISSLNILMYSNDNALIKQMVAAGRALSIHTMFLKESNPDPQSDGFQLLPLRKSKENEDDQEQEMNVIFSLFYHKKRRLNRAEQLFVQLLRKNTKKWRTDFAISSKDQQNGE